MRHVYSTIIGFLACFVASTCCSAFAADIAQARYLSQSEFFHSLTQVSLSLKATGDPFAEYLPAENARDMIQNALAKRGIAVRPNSPVAMEVEVRHDQGSAGDEVIHDVLITVSFYVRGVALRNGKFHVLPVAAASAWSTKAVLEPNDLQRALLYETTRKRIAEQFADGIASTFKTIDSNTSIGNVPWPPAAWTDKEKAQANTDLARAMRADTPLDSSLTLGIDEKPTLHLESQALDSSCPKDTELIGLWNQEFQALKWTRMAARPGLTVRHFTGCETIKTSGISPYLRVIHHVYLTEANVLFEMKGELVRQNAALDFSQSLNSRDRKDDESENRTWTLKRASNAIRLTFDDSILHDMGERPDLPGAALAAIAGSSPNAAPAGRVILGGDVRIENGAWHYTNGREVPSTLLDKSTGAPPLMPRVQRPANQAPASTSIATIKATLTAIKSCQLYTSASKDNLLWSVLAPAFEMDDSGVIVSRYVLSTRPGQGYAQGASLANLALLSAQVQDRGGCKILSIPCKNGQCVRFEDNANPSLSFFVETADQANRILNELKTLAPLYPDGAGELKK